MNNKYALSGFGAFIGTLALWLGLSFYSVGKVAEEINNTVTHPDPQSSLKFKNLHHNTGLLSSKGDVLVALVDPYSTEEDAQEDLVWVEVQYDMSHVILPTSLARFEWRLQPQPEDKAAFEKIFPKDFALSGVGSIGLDRSVSSSLQLPALDISEAGNSLKLSPSHGFVKVSDSHFKFDFNTDNLTYKSDGQAVEVDMFKLDLDIADTHKGIGSSSLSVKKINSSVLNLEGLKLAAESVSVQQKLDFRLSQSLDKLTVMEKTFSNMQAEWILGGLQQQSTEKLIQIMDDSRGFTELTAESERSMRQAIKVLFLEGWKIGLSKFNAQTDAGAVKGQLVLELDKDANGQLNLEKNLKLSGEINVTGTLLNADQQDTLVKLGIAVKSPEGLQASVNMANGTLKLNGKDSEEAMVRKTLKDEQSKLELFFSGTDTITN